MHLSQNLSKGSVFDVSKKRLEALLKAYDKQLYLEWRPKIRQWQIRRKPDFKFSFKIGETNGKSIFMLFTVENEVDSSILDLPALTYFFEISPLTRLFIYSKFPRSFYTS